jgi:predicted dehydrogenase
MSVMALGFGLIGAGDIVRKRVAPALRDSPLCRFAAVARAQADLAAAFAEEFGAAAAYASEHDLLKDPAVEAVYIATPVDLHAPQAMAAAEAGKHVLCEKPMALDTSECDQMIDACRSNGVRLGVAYYRHFYPAVDRIKRALAAGEIGKPVFAQVNAFERFDLPRDHPRAWFLDKARAGGGPMFDFGCHRIEVLMNVIGPVRGVDGRVSRALFDRDVEDTAVTVLRFDAGTFGVICVSHATQETKDTLDIFGTGGSIHVPVLNTGDIVFKTAGGERLETHPPNGNFHLPLIEDFVAAVETGREPAVDGPVGREVARIEQEIYAS